MFRLTELIAEESFMEKKDYADKVGLKENFV